MAEHSTLTAAIEAAIARPGTTESFAEAPKSLARVAEIIDGALAIDGIHVEVQGSTHALRRAGLLEREFRGAKVHIAAGPETVIGGLLYKFKFTEPPPAR